jgi:hypothetical protein
MVALLRVVGRSVFSSERGDLTSVLKLSTIQEDTLDDRTNTLDVGEQ